MMMTTKKNPNSPGVKAAITKGPIELSRAAKATAWTRQNGKKDDANNPYFPAKLLRAQIAARSREVTGQADPETAQRRARTLVTPAACLSPLRTSALRTSEF